ncbi:hypothetical protein, partial [Fructobacillus ficulneus]|uniref:hypothetical protein n=1 Tax=Fructobacillus ficulneus TaxID=157463 RepID=UPI000A4FE15B
TALVNQAVTQARLAIQEAQIKVDLQNAVTQGLTAISQISQPTLEPAYQAINSTDRAQAIQQLKTVAEQKQAEFRQIIGVEPQSLTDQLAAVDQALAQALVGVNQAQINKDLQNAIQTGKQLINQVAEPTIRAELQPATSEEKAQAKEILALAVKSRAKAFAEIAHVDPESLQTQLLSLNQSETTGQSKIDQAATKGDLMQAMQGALTLVNQVAEPIIQADYQSVTLLDRFAVNQDLLRAANAKMTIFEQINHVDFQSLTQQKLAINQALSLGQQLVNQAQIRLDLNQAHQKGLAAIEAVAQPSILRAYQPATEAEKAAGRNALARAVDQQKVNFAAIAHVDNQSLATQNQQLDLALQSSQGAIDQAQTKGDLDQAIQTGLAKIQQVPAPTIEDDYQPVTVIDREVAQQEITEAAANRKADFAGIAHVDPQSLTEQVGKIDQFVHAGEFAIAQAQTRGALRAAVSQALHQIDQVSEPVLEQPYRSVSMADRRRAVDQVQGAAEMQKAINGRIAHVDQESLAQKNQMVDDAVLQGMRAIRFARNQGELALAVTEAEQEIDQVGLPLAEYPYRFVTPADLYAAVQFLHQAATEKKAELARVVQADLHSLAEKQSTVDLARVFAEDAMGSAKINQDLMDELNKGINAINAVGNPEIFESFRSATDDDRNRAVSQVHSYVEERKQAFRALDHVNQLSLAAQEKQLDQILTQAQQAIEKAQTKGDVGREVFTAYQAVLAVTQPEIETTYQKPDQSNKDSAIAVVTKMADDKKNDFAKIAHVDPASLVRQNAAISRLLDDLVAAIKKAQTKGDLLQTLVKGLRDLNKIQSPTLQNQYQPATDQARTAAGEKLNQSGQAQIDAWKKLVHVDPLSFGQQSDLVKQVISDGQTTIAKSQTNGDLDRALADALAKLKKISQPDLMIDYQPATD